MHYEHNFKQASVGRLASFNNSELGYMAPMASEGRLDTYEGLILGANFFQKSSCRAILLPFYHLLCGPETRLRMALSDGG